MEKNYKKKLFFYKTILIILIILAIIIGSIIGYNFYQSKKIEEKNAKIIETFYDTEEKEQLEQMELDGHKVIGIIEIPIINLEYPIIEQNEGETINDIIKISISKFSGGEINSLGNVSLAGHNNYSGTMFGKNKNLNIGDKIYLIDLSKNKLEYEIYSIFSTDPNDTTILESQDENIREVTLITCKNGKNERLIIKAKEIK